MSKKRDTRRDKRERFLRDASRGRSRRGVLKWAVVLGLAAVLVLVGAALFSTYGGRSADQPAERQIDMTDTEATLADGKLAVSLNTIKQKGLVYFEYKGTNTVPLLAYVGPSGKLITAVSVCEPCRSTRFHILGDQLVCNTCGTVWELETHQGVSGGCTDFPPEIVPHAVKGGQVLVDEQAVLDWKPRA